MLLPAYRGKGNASGALQPWIVKPGVARSRFSVSKMPFLAISRATHQNLHNHRSGRFFYSPTKRCRLIRFGHTNLNGRSVSIMKRFAIKRYCALPSLWLAVLRQLPRRRRTQIRTRTNQPRQRRVVFRSHALANTQLNMFGVGGRIGFNVHRHVVLEGEMAYDFEQSRPRPITAAASRTPFGLMCGAALPFWPKIQPTVRSVFALLKAVREFWRRRPVTQVLQQPDRFD